MFVGDWSTIGKSHKPPECTLSESQGSSPQILWLTTSLRNYAQIKIVVGSSRFAYVDASKRKVGSTFTCKQLNIFL